MQRHCCIHTTQNRTKTEASSLSVPRSCYKGTNRVHFSHKGQYEKVLWKKGKGMGREFFTVFATKLFKNKLQLSLVGFFRNYETNLKIIILISLTTLELLTSVKINLSKSSIKKYSEFWYFKGQKVKYEFDHIIKATYGGIQNHKAL